MGNKIDDFDPGYILEKWQKYLGDAKPNPISDTRHIHLRNYLSKWIDRWGEGSYTEMSKYLNIIYIINTKGFIKYSTFGLKKTIDDWLPLDIISIFERLTKGDISNVEYRGLHSIIEREYQSWLKYDNVKKEMNQIQRDIKINNILS